MFADTAIYACMTSQLSAKYSNAGRAQLIDLVQLQKGKVMSYSLPSVGPRADPGVQAVSLQR